MTRASDTARLVSGGAVFNEASNDVDFRVEGNGNANMLVVDAGNDRVGVGTNTPDFPLDIQGSVADDAVTTVVRISADDPAASGEHAELQIKCGNGASDTATRRVELHAFSANGSEQRNICLNPTGGNVLIGSTSSDLNSTNADERIILESDGEYKMQGAAKILMTLNRNQTAGEIISIKQQNTAVGGIDANSSSVDFNTSSDYRLKENVTTSWDATTRLKQLKPSRFSWKKEGKSEADTDGFLAHEVTPIVPQATKGEKDEVVTKKGIEDGTYPKDAKVGDAYMQSIDHSKLVPLLTKSLQEALARIDTLEAEVAKLKG